MMTLCCPDLFDGNVKFSPLSFGMEKPLTSPFFVAVILSDTKIYKKSNPMNSGGPSCLFQLCLFHDATFLRCETISGTLPQCVLRFCVHMYSFVGLIGRTLPPTFSDTAITDGHSGPTIFQLKAHCVRISWSIGSIKSFGHEPPVGLESSTTCVNGEYPIH